MLSATVKSPKVSVIGISDANEIWKGLRRWHLSPIFLSLFLYIYIYTPDLFVFLSIHVAAAADELRLATVNRIADYRESMYKPRRNSATAIYCGHCVSAQNLAFRLTNPYGSTQCVLTACSLSNLPLDQRESQPYLLSQEGIATDRQWERDEHQDSMRTLIQSLATSDWLTGTCVAIETG